ncbi:Uncharacterised protein [Mycobacteroides abscessus subsp. abscessus]|nr:Uncharacterised protein [Mycobacteroides abscessus subsp. abscessus]
MSNREPAWMGGHDPLWETIITAISAALLILLFAWVLFKIWSGA